jgi:DNA-binding XRE family transcriptional regulator
MKGHRMVKRRDDFDDFLREVQEESRAAGKSATEALRAYGEHFRLARQLVIIRKQLGWTQQQLAKASGVQQSEISRIERGQGNPTYSTIEALARAANMTVAIVPRLQPTRRPGRRKRRESRLSTGS